MKKFIMLAFIAASIGVVFTACSSDDGGTKEPIQNELIIGNWQYLKSVYYDKEGNVLEEEIKVYNDCNITDHFAFQKDNKLTEYYSDFYQNQCNKYAYNGVWSLKGDIFSFAFDHAEGTPEQSGEYIVKKLTNTEMLLEFIEEPGPIYSIVDYFKRIE